MNIGKTSIRISESTRAQHRLLKGAGETYDHFISRLIDLTGRDAFFNELDHIIDQEVFTPLQE
jgi:hypothetical protein